MSMVRSLFIRVSATGGNHNQQIEKQKSTKQTNGINIDILINIIWRFCFLQQNRSNQTRQNADCVSYLNEQTETQRQKKTHDNESNPTKLLSSQNGKIEKQRAKSSFCQATLVSIIPEIENRNRRH